MTGDEHQAKEIVADVVVDRRVEVRHGHLLPGLQLVPHLLMLALEHLAPAQQIDRPMLGRGHEPGARLVGNAGLGPLLQRGDQRILRQVLGDTDIAHDPGEAGDEPGRLDPPDGVDRSVGIGSRHGYNLAISDPHSRSAPRPPARTPRRSSATG